jgi:hypothetical protein
VNAYALLWNSLNNAQIGIFNARWTSCYKHVFHKWTSCTIYLFYFYIEREREREREKEQRSTYDEFEVDTRNIVFSLYSSHVHVYTPQWDAKITCCTRIWEDSNRVMYVYVSLGPRKLQNKGPLYSSPIRYTGQRCLLMAIIQLRRLLRKSCIICEYIADHLPPRRRTKCMRHWPSLPRTEVVSVRRGGTCNFPGLVQFPQPMYTPSTTRATISPL